MSGAAPTFDEWSTSRDWETCTVRYACGSADVVIGGPTIQDYLAWCARRELCDSVPCEYSCCEFCGPTLKAVFT